MNRLTMTAFIVLSMVLLVSTGNEGEFEFDESKPAVEEDEKLEWTKNSVCNYCQYCKFCGLCDEQCPCETSASQPACKMCKYCKYCPVCKACDTLCVPGGVVDRASASLFSAFSFDEAEKNKADEEIESVQTWIDKKRDEL